MVMARWLLAALVVLGGATGCHSGRPPELRVLGVNEAAAAAHVFVQVTNPATRAMRLTKLEYRFASARSGTTVSAGEIRIEREVPAGSAVVVEVPLSGGPSEALTLQGKLTAELDQIVRTFGLAVDIQPR